MKSTPPQIRYPKVRIDALSDGIFAVAMTLLVLDIRFPEGFHPADSEQMVIALLELWPKFLAYAVSFMILGLRWLSVAQMSSRAEFLSGPYIKWWLIYLLLITCVPFTTIVVGRYAAFAPAIWLYCGNTALIAIASWRMAVLFPEVEDQRHVHQRRGSMAVLLVSSLLCIAWSFIDPRNALWVFLLNLAAPTLMRLGEGKAAADQK